MDTEVLLTVTKAPTLTVAVIPIMGAGSNSSIRSNPGAMVAKDLKYILADDVELRKRGIKVAKEGSLSSTGNRDFADRMAEGEISPMTLERPAEDQSLRYTGANDRTAFSYEFSSRPGISFSSQSRVQEEEAGIARQQLEREERNRRGLAVTIWKMCPDI